MKSINVGKEIDQIETKFLDKLFSQGVYCKTRLANLQDNLIAQPIIHLLPDLQTPFFSVSN